MITRMRLISIVFRFVVVCKVVIVFAADDEKLPYLFVSRPD